jgi:hypothetical protein
MLGLLEKIRPQEAIVARDETKMKNSTALHFGKI